MRQHATCATHGAILTFETVNGRLLERCHQCERFAARHCIECGTDIAQRGAQAKRCLSCYRLRRQFANNATRARTCLLPACKAAVAIGSKRRYCCDKCSRLARNALDRQRWKQNAPFRTKRLAKKTKWRQTDQGRASHYRSKRKGRLDGTWGYPSREAYLAAQREHNADPERLHKRRQWAHDRQTKYGSHTLPTCATCGTVIKWNGVGLPRKYCPPCHPWRKGDESSTTSKTESDQ